MYPKVVLTYLSDVPGVTVDTSVPLFDVPVVAAARAPVNVTSPSVPVPLLIHPDVIVGAIPLVSLIVPLSQTTSELFTVPLTVAEPFLR